MCDGECCCNYFELVLAVYAGRRVHREECTDVWSVLGQARLQHSFQQGRQLTCDIYHVTQMSNCYITSSTISSFFFESKLYCTIENVQSNIKMSKYSYTIVIKINIWLVYMQWSLLNHNTLNYRWNGRVGRWWSEHLFLLWSSTKFTDTQCLFQTSQLQHEVFVGLRYGPGVSQPSQSLVQREPLGFHDVCQSYGDGSGTTCVAMKWEMSWLFVCM